LELSVVAISICILAGRSVRAQTTPAIDAHVARLQTVGDERPVGGAAKVAPESPDHTGLPRSFLLWLADVEAGATRSKATATMRRVTKRGGFLL
jgi:hypothetical protein